MEIVTGIIVGSIILIIGTLFGKWINRDAAQKAVDLAFPKTIDLLIQHEFIKAGIQFRESFFNIIEKLESREILQPPGGGQVSEQVCRAQEGVSRVLSQWLKSGQHRGTLPRRKRAL